MALIELENVCLDYILKTGTDSFKKTVIYMYRYLLQKNSDKITTVKHTSYRALNNINLTINSGDRIGLIGKNGAGKSTLLKVMAKVYKPNNGNVLIQGKISSLFDVCLGMDMESTGYENITHLSIMRGFNRKTAKNIALDVADFTELGDFLHAPVRTYSSGMLMKLAFAVATTIPPEIILIDEVIGVGDAYFMQKANSRIENIVKNSQILVLANHSNEIIRQFCNKVIVLEKGVIKFFGDTESGIEFYDKGLLNNALT